MSLSYHLNFTCGNSKQSHNFQILYAGDCKEGYYIGVEVAKDDTHATKRFLGPNVWPSAGSILAFYLLHAITMHEYTLPREIKDKCFQLLRSSMAEACSLVIIIECL